ncbi:MAG TPA: anthranilate synthase component I [Anaerolineales bacterium]
MAAPILTQDSNMSSQPANLIPVVRELPADLETPVSVYLKLAGNGPSFLLESVTGGEQVARYSFIGVDFSRAYVLRDGRIERHSLGEGASSPEYLPLSSDPLDELRRELSRYQPQFVPGLPRFSGGLVGYLSYDVVRYFEPSVTLTPHPDLPEAIFLLADTLIAFDHAYGRLLLVANVHLNGDLERSRIEAEARLDALERRLSRPLPEGILARPAESELLPTELTSNVSREQFTHSVEQAKELIAAGEIFQVVLSQRLSRETDAAPFDIYRSLRGLNPSPYMYYFDFDGLAAKPAETDPAPLYLIGASPEMHVRLEGRQAAVRPIAGTRSRGKTPAEDISLEKELLADPKERSEHIMLVDLGRNDLGRVCEYGTVRVPEQMIVERYSHVMHIVSHVEGRLRPEYDAFDLLRATFPAGTVSGAPKIRAMQIIKDLETGPRGPYAGAVGYISYDGSLDTCITIRTITMQGRTVSVQAGAGIVADSDPEGEYQETLNKARALAVAIERAEGVALEG